MAGSARMFSKYWKKVKGLFREKGVALAATDQMRNKINSFGNPETTSGGEATKHNTDQRSRIRRKVPDPWAAFGAEKVKGIGVSALMDEQAIGGGSDRYSYHEATTVKNKIAPPFRTYNLRIWTKDSSNVGRGVDPVADTMYYLMMTGQAEKRGSRYMVAMHTTEGEVLHEKSYTWKEFKSFILEPSGTRISSTVMIALPESFDIRKACFEQVQDRSAFVLYAEHLKRVSGGTSSTLVKAKILGIIEGYFQKSARSKKVETVVGLEVKMPGDHIIQIGLPDADAEEVNAWVENPDLIVGKEAYVQTDGVYLLSDMKSLHPHSDDEEEDREEVEEKPKSTKRKRKSAKPASGRAARRRRRKVS